MKHKFAYKWTLKDADFTKDKGKVFSCFACGGGSSMGYKLAGFDVVGCNEIDPRMNSIYVRNLHPKHNYLCDIRELVKMDLPPELFNLDILDGSPPCSTFSIAGSREEAWGKMKKFREGQAEQVLDTLFFDFIELSKRLQPKVVVAENVKGLMLGNAKDYVRRIYQGFDDAGYNVQHYLLDAQNMGVPQRRQRVFFVCLRKDLVGFVPCEQTLFDAVPYLDLNFNEPPILFGEVADYNGDEIKSKRMRKVWEARQPSDDGFGDITKRINGKESMFNMRFGKPGEVSHTLVTDKSYMVHYERPCYYSDTEVVKVQSFPVDYDFAGQRPHYVCGMSVPPVMMANVASNIYEQWLSKL